MQMLIILKLNLGAMLSWTIFLFKHLENSCLFKESSLLKKLLQCSHLKCLFSELTSCTVELCLFSSSWVGKVFKLQIIHLYSHKIFWYWALIWFSISFTSPFSFWLLLVIFSKSFEEFWPFSLLSTVCNFWYENVSYILSFYSIFL